MRNPTREVWIGSTPIGAHHPVAVQSMAATRTQDIPATVRQVELLEAAGADLIRVAVDSRKDVEALAEISERAAAHNISMHFRHTIRNPIGGCTDHPKCTKINSG